MSDDYDDHEDLAFEHHVPVELLTLYEVLEWEGKIELPPSRPPMLLTLSESKIISRAEWRALPPKGRTGLSNPEGSTAHWEGPELGWPWPHESCYTKVRGIQRFHMHNRRWDDIAYNSIPCPHGYIFVGRWWKIRSAANGTNEGNRRSYAHCYLGGQNDPFTEEGKAALRRVFDLARSDGGAGGSRWSHSDWRATACPGPDIRPYVRAGLPSPTPPPQPQPDLTDKPTREQVMALPVLREGAKGHHVRILQSLLIAHAPDIVAIASGSWDNTYKFVDGHFGPGTKSVLSVWQERTQRLHKIEHGFCGGETWAWLVGI